MLFEILSQWIIRINVLQNSTVDGSVNGGAGKSIRAGKVNPYPEYMCLFH